METRIGNLTFTSKFDSGNLSRVEKVSKDDEEEETNRSKFISLYLIKSRKISADIYVYLKFK